MTATGAVTVTEAPGFGLLLPHLTFTRSPSKSRPEAQASAARSADARSTKFTNAHRLFATCTTLRICDGLTEERLWATRVRMEVSDAVGGKEERNIEVYKTVILS